MPLKFALAGNPNSGKTTLFNALTGSTAHVGNWPGVTVERKEGRYRKSEKEILVIDLPGIYSLSPYTPEERIARNYIISERPDVIIDIVDATNLERNLYLTTQLLEMGRPVIVALNMMDIVKKRGDNIDVASIAKVLGVPVVPIAASTGDGVSELMKLAEAAVSTACKPKSVLSATALAEPLEESRLLLPDPNAEDALYHAIKILEQDSEVVYSLDLKGKEAAIAAAIDKVKKLMPDTETESVIADARYKYITKYISSYIVLSDEAKKESFSDKVDRILTNRWTGIPIFLLMMFAVFHLTFTENLFFFTELPGPGRFLEGLFSGAIETFSEFLIGALETAGASEWAIGLVGDGILAGVGAVLGFLPLVLVLFLFLTILEDSGYMARAAYIMDGILRRFGLSGKAFVPMLMGFGCSVPAFSATRTLETDSDRKLTMMLIPFMSCGAKIPIYSIIGAALFPDNADFVVFGMYLLGVVVAIVAGIILKKTVFKAEAAPFIMELPPYHAPRIKSLLIRLWEKTKGFLIRAGTVILAATIVIWVLSNFSFTLNMVEPNSADSMIGVIGRGLQFVFMPLGFASGPDGWKASVAIITGLVAKEIVVSTMGQLYTGVEGDALEDDAAQGALMGTLAATFSPLAALSYMAFNLFSVPCMAAVGALRAELQSKKWFWFTLGFWVLAAYVVSLVIFQVGGLLFPALKVVGG